MRATTSIKMSEEAAGTIRAAAKEQNVSVSAFIRQAVSNQLRNDTELAEVREELRKINETLNQLKIGGAK